MKSRLHNFGGRDRANQDRGNFYRLSLVALALGILSLFCGGFAAAKDRGLDKSDAELREKFSLPTISLFGQTEASFLRSLEDHFIDVEIHRVKFSPVPRTVYNNIDATLDVIGDPEIKEINFYGRVEGARAKDHEAAMSVLSAALGAFCSAGPEDKGRALGVYSSLYIDRESKKRTRITSGRCTVTFEPLTFLGERCTITRGK